MPPTCDTYVWDKLNRVDLITQQSAHNPLSVTWSGRVATTRKVDLNYFADSTVQSISRTQGTGTATTAALVTTVTTVADGVKNEGRIASITQSGLTGGNVAYLYGYDDHGRVASFTSPAGTRTYAYDTFDQVTGATGGTQTAEAFAYDTNGNRTSVAPASGGGSAVIGSYNRVTDDGTYTYQYDKEGNRTRRTLKSNGEYETYVYDYRQRLVSVTKKNASNVTQQTVTYEYDGLNRRMRRTVKNAAGTVTQKQRFLYDSNVISASFDEVVIVLDELVSGQAYQQVDHRYLNGPAIDQVFADETPGDSVLWYLSDQQQTVRDVAKFTTITAGAQATVRNHLEYGSFGNVTSADDPTTGTANDGDLPGLEGVGNEYSSQRSYTGREPDPATGLIYYRARWYDPQLGRFISEDPIGFAAGDANLSRYVGNSTPNTVDPSGLDVGMHWIVQEILDAIPVSQMTDEANKYLRRESTPTDGAFRHGNDTFFDPITGEQYTHPKYNDYNKEFVDKFIKTHGKIDLEQAKKLRCMFNSPEEIIAAGKAMGVSDEAVEYLARYQTGYYRTLALAESLNQDFSQLTPLERKRLARLLAAGDKSKYSGDALKKLEELEDLVHNSKNSLKALNEIRGMSASGLASFLKKGFHKLGPALKFGGKLLGAAGVCLSARDAYAGSQGRGHHTELTGAIGAIDNAAYEAAFGEYVEATARAAGNQVASVVLPVPPSHIRNETRHGLEPLPPEVTSGGTASIPNTPSPQPGKGMPEDGSTAGNWLRRNFGGWLGY